MKRFRPNKLTTAIIIALIFSIFMACGDALAADWMSWDEKNTELNYYAMTLLMADMGQTLHIADNPEKYYEKLNFYLDEHPSRIEVKQYFGWYAALLAGATFVLPKGWSHGLQKIVIFDESYCVGGNIYLGIGFGFK